MTLKTKKMRTHIRGESLEDFFKRQKEIDKYQGKQFELSRTWTNRNRWGDSYDIN